MSTYGIFSAFYLPHMGGVENYTAHLAEELVQLGHKAIVVAAAPNEAAGIVVEGGVTVVRLPARILLAGRLPVLCHGAMTAELKEALKAFCIDYALVNTRFYGMSLFALRFAYENRIPAIVLEHGSGYLTLGNDVADCILHAYEHVVTAFGKRYGFRYYAVSQKSAEWLGVFGIEASGVLYNAIDADKYVAQASSRDFRKELALEPSDIIVVFTGRLVPEKGVRRVAEAIVELGRRGRTHIHAVFAGEGPEGQWLSGLDSEQVHLLGCLNPEDVSALLGQSDVFCLPTKSEGFSTSMLEAAAHGLGIIVTDTGGAKELIPDRSHGIVLQSNSSKSVLQAIVALAEDGVGRERAGKLVAARVRERFSWKSTANSLVDAFENGYVS